jgi:hypothetical protein
MTSAERRRAAAAKIMEQRKLRRTLFQHDLFDETAWELLLRLYLVAPDGSAVSRDRLIEDHPTSPHTVELWTRHLVQIDLVRTTGEREATEVALTPEATGQLERFLDEVAEILDR